MGGFVMLCLKARQRISEIARKNNVAITLVFELARYVRPPKRSVEVIEETYTMRAVRVAGELAAEFSNRARHI